MWFWIVLGIITGIALLISLVLAIPVDATLDLDVHEKVTFRARVGWLFGLVSFDTEEQKAKKEAVKKEPKPAKAKKPREKVRLAERRQQLDLVLEVLQTRGLITEIRKFLVRLYRCFDLMKLDGDFWAGLLDPAETGFFYGIYTAVTFPTDFPLARHIRLHPCFSRTTLEGHAQAVVRLRPIYLFAPVGLFVFSPPVLKVLGMLIRMQWRKRRSPREKRYQLAT